MKKLLSLLLSLAMLVSCASVLSVFAAEEAPSNKPTGTPITSVEEFETMAPDGVSFVKDSALINNGYALLSWQLPKSALAEGFSAGTIESGEGDNAYTIDSDSISAFVSARDAGEGKNDLRFVLAADYNSILSYETLTVTIEFATVQGVVKSTVITLDKLTVFASATAAGNTYTAAEGAVLFGLVVTDVPSDAWQYAVVSVSTTSDGVPAMAGIAAKTNILG